MSLMGSIPYGSSDHLWNRFHISLGTQKYNLFIVATNDVASQPPKGGLTGTLTARSNYKFLNLTLYQGIGSVLTELSSQLNTALHPLGEVTHKAIRAVESLFSAGCPRPLFSLGNSAILPANKEAASLGT